jgi:hypothetical protein
VTIEMVSAFKPSVTPVGLLIVVVWGARGPLAEFGEQGTTGAAVFLLLRKFTCVLFLLPFPVVDSVLRLGVRRRDGATLLQCCKH